MRLVFTMLAAVVLSCSSAPAQWLETTVPVYQSPEVLNWNAANNRVYCAVGYPDAFGAVVAIDGATNAVLDSVMLRCQMPGGMCIDPVHNRVFCAGSSYYPLDESLVTVIDADADTIAAEIQTGSGPLALCYNPTQDRLYCASQLANQVYIIDCATNAIRASRTVPAWPVDICYAPEVNRIYCASQGTRSSPNFMVSVISGSSDSLVRVIYVGYYPRALCYNRTDLKVYSANGFDGTVSVIDAVGDTVVATVTVGGTPVGLCWNPANDRVYCADGEGGFVTSIDGATNAVSRVIPVVGPVWAVTADSAVNKIYCSNYTMNRVTILDGAADTILKTIATGAGPRAMCHNPARGRVYVANRDDNSVAVIRDSASGGIEERPGFAVRDLPMIASIACGVLQIPQSVFINGQSRVALLDAAGRRVQDLCPGSNDVSRLTPGVYFVRAAYHGAGHRVIVTR